VKPLPDLERLIVTLFTLHPYMVVPILGREMSLDDVQVWVSWLDEADKRKLLTIVEDALCGRRNNGRRTAPFFGLWWH